MTDVVRCCEPTYRTDSLLAEHILVHDWPFRDGAVVCLCVCAFFFVTLPLCLSMQEWFLDPCFVCFMMFCLVPSHNV